MIDLKFLKILMSMKQVIQKSALFATIGSFQKKKGLSFNWMSVMGVMMH